MFEEALLSDRADSVTPRKGVPWHLRQDNYFDFEEMNEDVEELLDGMYACLLVWLFVCVCVEEMNEDVEELLDGMYTCLWVHTGCMYTYTYIHQYWTKELLKISMTENFYDGSE